MLVHASHSGMAHIDSGVGRGGRTWGVRGNAPLAAKVHYELNGSKT